MKRKFTRKLELVFISFIKRFVAVFPQRYSDKNVEEIVKSLDTKSYYLYKNFFNSDEINNINKSLKEYQSEAISSGKSLIKDLTNKKVRTDILKSETIDLANYTHNKLILDVARKFHGIPCKVTKASYEIKEKGNNPENNLIHERLDDTIYYHFDRPYKVLKTYLILEDIDDKDGPMYVVSGSHKLFYKSPIKKLFRYFSKIFLYDHHYLLEHKDEKFFINDNDIISLKGNAGDLFFVNTEAWHCGRPMESDGRRAVLWNYIYGDHTTSWIKHLLSGKFLFN